MVPTIAQLYAVIILLVPGFICIKIYSKLTPTKKREAFDFTVLSVTVTLAIHTIYTGLLSYLFISHVNTIITEVANKQISNETIKWIAIYSIGLIIFTVIVAVFLAFIRDKGRLYKFIKFFNFTASPFDNLWDEIVFIYSLEKEAPLIIIHFEDESYAGYLHRSSFELDKSNTKEIILAKPKYRHKEDESWQICKESMIYLNLDDVKSIRFFNGDILLNSKL
ncbi:DUF6338 family protein [Bacillus cereus]